MIIPGVTDGAEGVPGSYEQKQKSLSIMKDSIDERILTGIKPQN